MKTWKHIEKLMKENNLSSKEIADIAGVWPSAITKWKRGSNIGSDKLQKIAVHFGVSTDSLLGKDTRYRKADHTPVSLIKEEPPSYGSPDTATRQHAVTSNAELLVDIIKTLPESDRVTGWFASSLMSARTAIDPTEKPEDAQRAAKETKRILDRIFNHAKKSRK